MDGAPITTTRDASAAAVRDLLKAERILRGMAEEENRDLRAALQLAAYTFAGAAYEAEIRLDQRILDHWKPDDWMAFFQRVAPVSEGWSDPGVLAERLREVTRERDGALAEVRRLQEELTLRADLVARQVLRPAAPQASSPPPPPPPEVQEEKRKAKQERKHRGKRERKGEGKRERKRETRRKDSGKEQAGGAGFTPAGYPGFRWPAVPDRPPLAYRRYFTEEQWGREGMGLALVAMGLSLRLEAQELLAQRENVSSRAGSMRRLFDRLVARGLLDRRLVRVGNANCLMLKLTDLGRKTCRACQFPVFETELERMLRLHGGEAQVEHAGATVVFAYHARRRGWQVQVLPEVEPPAEPDVLIARDGFSTYVEVELGRGKEPKWRNMFDLQQSVALCALTAEGRASLVREVEALSIPGRATDLQTLIKEQDDPDGRLWVESWE